MRVIGSKMAKKPVKTIAYVQPQTTLAGNSKLKNRESRHTLSERRRSNLPGTERYPRLVASQIPLELDGRKPLSPGSTEICLMRSRGIKSLRQLLAIDVVELSWEIQRYRILRHKLLDHYRETAIEQTLRHIDLAELPPEMEDATRYQIRRNARIWRIDPTTAREIDVRLATYGYDLNAINTQVYLQARDVFLAFEALLNSAQNRRVSLLREMNNRRQTGVNPKRHRRSD